MRGIQLFSWPGFQSMRSIRGGTSILSLGVLALVLGQHQKLQAAAWPQFRGVNAAGIADGEHPPTVFGPGTNELYHVATPAGASSPCIWGDRIFLTAFEEDKLQVLCLNRSNGQVIWQNVVPAEKIEA